MQACKTSLIDLLSTSENLWLPTQRGAMAHEPPTLNTLLIIIIKEFQCDANRLQEDCKTAVYINCVTSHITIIRMQPFNFRFYLIEIFNNMLTQLMICIKTNLNLRTARRYTNLFYVCTHSVSGVSFTLATASTVYEFIPGLCAFFN